MTIAQIATVQRSRPAPRRPVRTLRASLAVLLLLCVVPTAPAQDWESRDRLQQAARDALSEPNASIALDRNTRLPRCGNVPEAGVRSRNSSRASVEIRCQQPAWRIFVPATLNRADQVAVLLRSVAAGEVLREEDLHFEARDTRALGYGWIARPSEAVGRTTRRALAQGAVLTPNDLQQEVLVTTGDQVVLVSRQHGIEVRMRGQALSQGSRAQQIRVRNLSSGRTVEGTVIAAGEVEVMP